MPLDKDSKKDLEHRHLVDLLPNREKEMVARWLTAHPRVEVVSRDRGGAYAEAIREVLPHAVQVADRFHLSQNMGETVERMMRREYPRVKEILGGRTPSDATNRTDTPVATT